MDPVASTSLAPLQARLAAAECARDDAAEQLLLVMQKADAAAQSISLAADLRQEVKAMQGKMDVVLECLGEAGR